MDGDRSGGRNRNDMIEAKHYINTSSIFKIIRKLSNIIAITTTFIQCRPSFVNTL